MLPDQPQRPRSVGDGRKAEDTFWAHTAEGRPPQPLREHLEAVAELAGEFAGAFGSRDWGRLAGLWHDVGKYQPAFQERLRGATARVDHGVVGAALGDPAGCMRALPLAFTIAGHHGGLPNLRSSEQGRTPLESRLKPPGGGLPALVRLVPADIRERSVPPTPSLLERSADDPRVGRRRAEMWTRFLYSCLVDADYLDTEAYHTGRTREELVGGFPPLAEFGRRLDAAIAKVAEHAPATAVNRARARVLADCRGAAAEPPGLFTLTVPTGGGKTLSAMAFALRHAEAHALRRVIVVIPYTSVIEQNARIYRDALGEANVIEHHSSLDPDRETERNRLASENWDAPVIVTTSVQFFESLFADRPSRCRKLHNIARSVIVLDEVQALPAGLLEPILEALQELVAGYGCSVVLSTATQPALAQRDAMPFGLAKVRAIVPDPSRLAQTLRRTRVRWPAPEAAPTDWGALAEKLRAHRQVLAVVHLRRDARELARLVGGEDCYHLSALMCPRHRLDVLARVRDALGNDRPCRLISTQLVEAGVDLDFPVVYRALAGLDSVAQAAGRCNREGRADVGDVMVFRAPSPPPSGTPRKGVETVLSLLGESPARVDIHDPEAFAEYFRRLYAKEETDARGIQPQREAFNFANTAALFRIIEDGGTTPVVVPYADAAARVEACVAEPSRRTFRALQPYLVNLYDADVAALKGLGALVHPLGQGTPVLRAAFPGLYDPTYGLCAQAKQRRAKGEVER